MISSVLQAKNKLVIEEREIPVPASGQVRIQTVLAGICGSDIHALHGMQPSLKFPTVMGHELVGIVDGFAADEGDSSFKVGDRVVIDPSFRCGVCPLCVSGKENICEDLKVLGVHVDGGFSEYFLCDIDMLYKLPDDLSFDEAVFCEPLSIATHTVSRMTTSERNKAAVIGAGPIGLAMVMVLREIFKTVIVFEPLENRRMTAKYIGADLVLESDPSAYHGQDIDVVFDTVSIAPTARLSEKIVRRGGEIVVVGMANPQDGLSMLTILKKELTVRGTRMTRPDDFGAALQLLSRADAKHIKAIITGHWPLEKAEEAIRYAETNPARCIKEVIDFRR